MDAEPPRLALALSAFGGAVVYGTFHLLTALWAGQPVERTDVLRAFANVVAAIIVGVVTAYFLGPALMPAMPIGPMRDPYVIGFGIGFGGLEVAPFVSGWVRNQAKKLAKEKR